MVARRTDPLNIIGINRVAVHGNFRPQGASALVAADDVDGKGFSVVRTSLGLNTITFDDVYNDLVSFHVGVRSASGTGVNATFGDFSQSARTLQVRTFSALGNGVGHIPLDITALREIASSDIQALAAHGGLLASDSDPSLANENGATDKAMAVTWDTAADTDEVAFPPIAWPADLDAAQDVTVHLLALMATGGMDTPTIDVQAWEGIGDTEMGGVTAALSTTLAELTRTITAANIAGHPGFLNLQLVPGVHTNEALSLYAAWIEYAKAATLIDLAADADNEIGFTAIFRDSSVDY